MTTITAREVRRKFLEFYAERGHQVVPTSPLILPQDRTLLFANAGMNQFKEVFRGVEARPYKRAASVQKCLRVSGKHNDLEEVGRTPRHHTFFEMLGNFSFGDYFKRDAIRWAWELVTQGYGLPAERIYVTVFAGDDEFPGDAEAAQLWSDEAGLPESHITALGRKDNFWQMGDTGPAGPCSELHVDLRPDDPALATPATDPDRFLEFWNLVFMQYDLQADGTSRRLPAPCVDTGMGLERLTALLNRVPTNYDTDLFLPIIESLAAQAQVSYGANIDSDVSLRVIADHLRAITVLIAEGVIPGPEKRGAVLRRILRRALRHGRRLQLPVPFLSQHVHEVVAILGEAYPDLAANQSIVERVTQREEERFDRTLSAGFELLELEIDAVLQTKGGKFPGEQAFVLESERGLPLDLIKDALDERQVELDTLAYDKAKQAHVVASRVVKDTDQSGATLDVYTPWKDRGSLFVGRQTLRADASRVLAVLKGGQTVTRLGAGETGEVILDQTPFYAESGGQAGDHGTLTGGDARATVLDTLSPVPGVVLHRVRIDLGTLVPDALVVAEVDARRRQGAMRHHTATHLAHAALRRVLGTHVKQAGSLVAPDRLRFDFSHFEGVTPEALREVETDVNAAVQADLPVETDELPLEQALASGAMAFFGDRYGDRVRVVRIGEVSLELCGGTHVARTGEIGACLVVGERGVAAGVRRVEAVAGPEALERAREDMDSLTALAERVSAPRGEVLAEIQRKLDLMRKLQKENEDLRLRLARQNADGGGETIVEVGGLSVVSRRADGLARNQRRDLADSLRQKHPDAVVVLGAAEDGKAALVVAVGAGAAGKVDAREVIRRIGPIVGGGGGGKADIAEAGGKDPDRLDEALAAAADAVRALTGAH